MPGPVAFVVLAHKNPDQVRRLAARLAPNPVYVHVDARSPADVYQPLVEMEVSGALRLLPRFRSGWASWAIVEAVLAGLRTALEAEPSHIVAMTGQCYPLWPAAALTEYITGRPDTSWIHQHRIPVPARAIGDRDGGLGRITKWHLTVRGRHLRLPVRRPLPPGVVGHYGQMQCCLSAPMARWLVDEVGRRPELSRFFRRTQAPDELLIPSLALSSPLASHVDPDNLWYANWLQGGPHPKTLSIEDYDSLADHARHGGDMAGPSPVKLFARKFERGVSDRVLERIDRELLHAEPP